MEQIEWKREGHGNRPFNKNRETSRDTTSHRSNAYISKSSPATHIVEMLLTQGLKLLPLSSFLVDGTNAIKCHHIDGRPRMTIAQLSQ